MRCRHEGSRLLVPGHDQLDSGAAQRFDDVEVLFARNAEDLLDTLILQGGNEQVRAFHGPHSSLGAWEPPGQFPRSGLTTTREPVRPERPASERNMTCAALYNRAGTEELRSLMPRENQFESEKRAF